MDSIRHSQFTPTARMKSQGNALSQDACGDESGGEKSDGYSESLAPQEEMDSEEERAQGERHEEELLEKYPLWEDESAFQLMDQLLIRLQPFMFREELEYEFLPLDAAVPFASSCPNGAIYFTRGILQALAEEEVLFFAAHELAHTELRHYATRHRRLSELRQSIPAPLGSPTRVRMDMAAVLVVRHQEEFEADHQAAQWVGSSLALSGLSKLHALCERVSPESLQRPTHPKFEKRLAHLREGRPFPHPLDYLYTLLQ